MAANWEIFKLSGLKEEVGNGNAGIFRDELEDYICLFLQMCFKSSLWSCCSPFNGGLQSVLLMHVRNKCLHLYLQTNIVIPLSRLWPFLASFSLFVLKTKPFQKKWKNAEEISSLTPSCSELRKLFTLNTVLHVILFYKFSGACFPIFFHPRTLGTCSEYSRTPEFCDDTYLNQLVSGGMLLRKMFEFWVYIFFEGTSVGVLKNEIRVLDFILKLNTSQKI